MRDKIEQIAKLLSLAEKAGSKAESELAYFRAQQIAALYSVDLAIARRQMHDRTKREEPIQQRISFADALATKNTKKSLVELVCAIATSYDIKVNVIGNSTGIIGFGYPSDLDMMQRMFGVIAIQMVKSASDFVASKEYRNEMVPKYNEWGGYEGKKAMDGRIARQNFYASFIAEISSRLQQIKFEVETSVKDQKVKVLEDDGSMKEISTDLVLVGKRDVVEKFYKDNSRARGTWQAARSVAYSSSASEAGRAAGRSARLGREAQLPGVRRGITT